jgi:hypothetical protein
MCFFTAARERFRTNLEATSMESTRREAMTAARAAGSLGNSGVRNRDSKGVRDGHGAQKAPISKHTWPHAQNVDSGSIQRIQFS